MNSITKQIIFLLFLTLLVFPLTARAEHTHEHLDTAYLFRFVPRNDMFYVPYENNLPELNRLCEVLQSNIEHLRAGRMYICVSSYAASASSTVNAQRMAYLRNNRVKSELIMRAGITEEMFVTDRLISAPYNNNQRNVVVVSFPASVLQIEKIAGEKAAEVVRTYYREIEIKKENEINAKIAEQKQREAAAHEAEQAKLRAIEEEQAQHRAEAEHAEAERQRLAAQEQARLQALATAKPHSIALRANLLRWVTLTPDLGLEWRITRDWGVAVDGSWTSWDWDNNGRRYALWEVSPSIHYYIGKQRRGYVGAMYHIGQFNYKLSDIGKQGTMHGGGVIGGYKLPIGKRLMLDFNLGFGCTHAKYEKYTVIEGVRVRRGNEIKNYWGINQVGVTLVLKLF